MQCPVCGRTVAELIEGACATCTSERAAFLELAPILDVTACAHCGRLEGKSGWHAAPGLRDERLREIVRREAAVDKRLVDVRFDIVPRWEDEKNAEVTARLAARFADIPVERNRSARVRFKTSACPDCSREKGGYFEAILQVRGDPGADLDRLFPEIERTLKARVGSFRDEGRPGSFFSRIEAARGGQDYYVGSHETARILGQELAVKYGAERLESSKLVGRRDGRDLYRSTHLVRLPAYAPGDFIALDRKPYKVLSMDHHHLVLLDLDRQGRVRRDLRRVSTPQLIGRRSDQREALIVSRSGGSVQILDPDTYRTVDMPLTGIESTATSVPLFRWQDTLYVVVDVPSQTRQ